jgi:hypothetical protein
MLTANQLDDTFQSQLGRAPTDYEVSTYQNASPQTLANIKGYYGALNTSNGVSDYLRYTGVDPATAPQLAQKYGISNYGTVEGNNALLAALKSGTAPAATATPTVTGTIAPSTTTPATSTAVNDPTINTTTGSTSSNPTQGNDGTPQTYSGMEVDPTGTVSEVDGTGTAGTTMSGTVAGAAGSSSTAADPMAQYTDATNSAYANQQAAQKAVNDIDTTLANVKSQRMAAIAASGGVVDEAALTSELYAENQPLLAQRKQLVDEYTQANQAYQKAVSDQNTAQSNYVKTQQLSQGQEKIDETSTKDTDTATYQAGELALKSAGLDSSEWKAQQVPIYQDGQVVGKQVVAVNASTGAMQILQATDSNGNPVSTSATPASSSTVAGVNFGSSSTVGAYATDPNYSTKISKIYNAIQSTGLDFQTPTDIQTYITNNASTSTVTGNMILAAARQYGVDPTLLASVLQNESNFGTTGAGAKTNNPGNVGNTDSGATKTFDTVADGVAASAKQLQRRVDYGDPDMNLAYSLATGTMAPSQASKRAASYTNVLNDANTISQQLYGKPYDAAVSDADYKYASNTTTQNTLNYLSSLVGTDGKSGNLQALVNASNAIQRTNFPALNNTQAWAKLSAGDPQYAAYFATITEVSDQVAKILQGGNGSAGTSDAKLQQAQSLFDKGFSGAQIAAVASALAPLLGNRAAGLIGTNPFLQNMYGGLTALQDTTGGSAGSSFAPRGNTDAKTFVASTFSTLYPGQSEAGIQAQYKSQLKSGDSIVFRNSDGAIMIANPKNDDMSLYTVI